MGINIVWVDNCNGTETVEKVKTPLCCLSIHRRDDVITQIEWNFTDNPKIEVAGAESAGFWPDSEKTVTLKLLKQGTAHQNKVWAELLKIPPGETLTYSAIAKKIGSAPRAVGNACRDNPYPLIIPCHRVVAVNGMGGYSGQRHGEFMKLKERLLDYEAKAASGKFKKAPKPDICSDALSMNG